jgi:hypothetical protein
LCENEKQSTFFGYYHAVTGASSAFGGLLLILFCMWCCIRRHYRLKEQKLMEEFAHAPKSVEVVRR